MSLRDIYSAAVNRAADSWEEAIDRREQKRQARRSRPSYVSLIGIFLTILLALGLFHVWQNYQARDNPPTSCQLLGGTWNFWDGWRCR